MKKPLKETPETKKFSTELRKNGFYVKKISDRYTGGVLDLIAIYRGTVFFIEMKVNKNVMSALQRKTAEDIASKKGLSFCVTMAYDTKGEREIMVEVFQWDYSYLKNFETYSELITWLKLYAEIITS